MGIKVIVSIDTFHGLSNQFPTQFSQKKKIYSSRFNLTSFSLFFWKSYLKSIKKLYFLSLARVPAHLFIDFVCPLPSPKFPKYSSVAAQVNFMILEKKNKRNKFRNTFLHRPQISLINFISDLSLSISLLTFVLSIWKNKDDNDKELKLNFLKYNHINF